MIHPSRLLVLNQRMSQITIPTLMAPQLRTTTGLANVPPRRDKGPPQDATSRKSRDTIPAMKMNAISIRGPVKNPMPPAEILEPNPWLTRVGMASQVSQANQCPMRVSQAHISSERHAL